jgi:hypothetical protein
MKNKLGLSFVLLLISSSMALADPCKEPRSIKSITKSRSGNYEYVTIEYIKPPNPDYKVRTAHRPFERDGSGDPVSIRGNYFKSILFRGVVWTCDIRENLSAKTEAVRDVQNIGQFEGDIEYVIGYKNRSSYVGNYFRDVGPVRKIYVKFKR